MVVASHDLIQPPKQVAFVEHTEAGGRLGIVDVKTKRKRYPALLEGELEHFLWSTEHNALVYTMNDRAFLHFIATGTNQAICQEKVLDFPSSFLFVPDSASVVVATTSGFCLAAFDSHKLKEPRIIPYSNQAEPIDLLCSPKGLTLLSLSQVENEVERYSLTLTKLADAQQKSQVVAVDRLLGWCGSEPVACQSGQLFGEFIGTVGRDARFSLWSFDEDEVDNQDYPEVSESYVHSYLSVPNLAVLSSPIEHSADPLELFLASEKKKTIEPWLESFERIIDIKFSASGHWAVFTHAPLEEPSATEGDIYLARVGAKDAQLILKAVTGEIGYSLASLGV